MVENVLRGSNIDPNLHEQAYDLFMQAPAAISVYTGPGHTVVLANDFALQLAGKTREQVIGKPILEILPEIESQGFIGILDHVFNTGEPYTAFESPITLNINDQPHTLHLNLQYKPYRDHNNNIIGVIGFASDVTEQVMARRNIESAKESVQLAIGLADLGTYEINLQEDGLVTSERFNQIFDFTPPVTRAQLVASIHPDDRAIREAAYENSKETGYLFYEARIIWRDGSVHWIRVRGKTLYTKDHSPYKVIGVVQDISEHRFFAEQLSAKVAERTQELSDANDRLSRSNAELEQFAYVTSHDLQEPLRKIQVFSHMALDLLPPVSESTSYVQKISKSAKRMNDLIKNLLDYSRISKAAILFEQVDLNEIISGVIVDFELAIQQKKATLEIGQLEPIEAVPLQMNQLFYNLIANALKFTRKGVPPFIRISGGKPGPEELKDLEAGREYYKIEVRDNGIGFDQKYAEKIFTIFQRLNDNSVHGGYGIGLAICFKIVQNHKGMIYAAGKEQEGASFTIILPFKHH